MVSPYNGVLPSQGKGWNNIICSNMNGPRNYHTKGNKSDKEIKIYDTAYMQNLKKKTTWTNLQNGNRVTDL